MMIDDADECESAADALGARFIKADSYGSIPKGCAAELEDGDVRVWFNEHETGKENSNRRPICLAAEEPETTAGAESEEETTEGEESETTESPEGEESEGETTEGAESEEETTEGAESEGETTEGEESEGETTEGAESEGETTEGAESEGETTEMPGGEEEETTESTEAPDLVPVYGEAGMICEGELMMIEDADGCSSAADALGARFIKADSFGAIPKGCVAELEDGDIRVWFNEHETGKANSNRRPICLIYEI